MRHKIRSRHRTKANIKTHTIAHNAVEVGSFARPLGNLSLSLFNERRKEGGRSTVCQILFFVGKWRRPITDRTTHTCSILENSGFLQLKWWKLSLSGIYSTRHVVIHCNSDRRYVTVIWTYQSNKVDFKNGMSLRNLSYRRKDNTYRILSNGVAFMQMGLRDMIEGVLTPNTTPAKDEWTETLSLPWQADSKGSSKSVFVLDRACIMMEKLRRLSPA